MPAMQTELLSDNEIAAGYSRQASGRGVVDYLGLLLSLPAAVAVIFVMARCDSSKFSLAASVILFPLIDGTPSPGARWLPAQAWSWLFPAAG